MKGVSPAARPDLAPSLLGGVPVSRQRLEAAPQLEARPASTHGASSAASLAALLAAPAALRRGGRAARRSRGAGGALGRAWARAGSAVARCAAAEIAPAARRRTGLLLLNIGTPASTSVEDVRSYLGRFLADDRVIEISPPPLKALLLQVLLATRPASSAENYKKVWSERGSPLLYHSEDLAEAMQLELGDDFVVRIGMAYSEPFVEDALRALSAAGVDDVALLPMFPHYASSTTGSILANAYRTAAEVFCTPFLKVITPFYDSPYYLTSMTDLISPFIGPRGTEVDHLLFSFHGLPEAQCSRTDSTGSRCLKQPGCCSAMVQENRNCYRAQCFETARLLAERLELKDGSWSVAFQSRLTLRGTIQWIRPYTDEALARLAEAGVKRLAVVAPSFTSDCVETLEELGITGREQFGEAGGEELVVIPCLNSSGSWVSALSEIVREELFGSPTKSVEAVCAPLEDLDDDEMASTLETGSESLSWVGQLARAAAALSSQR